MWLVQHRRRQLARRKPAEAALAAAHAAAGEGLQAIDLGGTKGCAQGLAQGAGADLLAAADEAVVGEIAQPVMRPGEGLREAALESAQPGEPASQRPAQGKRWRNANIPK